MTVNHNVGDKGWRLVAQLLEEEENKDGGAGKVTSSAGTNSHQSDLVCVGAHVHTRRSVSPTSFPL